MQITAKTNYGLFLDSWFWFYPFNKRSVSFQIDHLSTADWSTVAVARATDKLR